jgi:hypothetical protein
VAGFQRAAALRAALRAKPDMAEERTAKDAKVGKD